MAGLDVVRKVVALDHHLAVCCTTRVDGSAQTSVVNAGLLPHPVTGDDVAGMVVWPTSRKVTNMRARPTAALVWRAGWQWATLEGRAEMVGPDDPMDGIAPADLPGLVRTVFRAAGGEHDDWPTFDRAMADERRVVVFVHPDRTFGNP